MTNTTTTKIAILGCGNLGTSILEGLLDTGNYKSENITITRRHIDSLVKYREQGVHVTSDNKEAVKNADIILVGLKPHNILPVLREVGPLLPKQSIVVSLATAVSLAELEDAIQVNLPLYRAMPNTATTVQESVTCICSNYKDEAPLNSVKQLFGQLGTSVVIDENLMESATVLGACGIAFVLRFIRGMIQGGIQIGFDAKTAGLIVNQTVKGASQLLIQNGEHPEFEIDKVTTPRGCTIEGLNEMEHNGFSSALIKGIVTSFEKIEKLN